MRPLQNRKSEAFITERALQSAEISMPETELGRSELLGPPKTTPFAMFGGLRKADSLPFADTPCLLKLPGHILKRPEIMRGWVGGGSGGRLVAVGVGGYPTRRIRYTESS